MQSFGPRQRFITDRPGFGINGNPPAVLAGGFFLEFIQTTAAETSDG